MKRAERQAYVRGGPQISAYMSGELTTGERPEQERGDEGQGTIHLAMLFFFSLFDWF